MMKIQGTKKWLAVNMVKTENNIKCENRNSVILLLIRVIYVFIYNIKE